jgi:CRISPR/Cas system CSM-associated protein Csm2 small subunit
MNSLRYNIFTILINALFILYFVSLKTEAENLNKAFQSFEKSYAIKLDRNEKKLEKVEKAFEKMLKKVDKLENDLNDVMTFLGTSKKDSI